MMFYDETALDLFRRLTLRPLALKGGEVISFGEFVEILCPMGQITASVLETAIGFGELTKPYGVIVHISLAGDLKNSLFQAGVDITQFPGLAQMHAHDRIKEAVVHSLSSLIHTLSILQNSLNGEQCLVIFEGLNPLILSQRDMEGAIQSESLINDAIDSVIQLLKCQNVIALWFSTVLGNRGGAVSGALREGPPRDPLTTLWRSRVKRAVYYTSD